MFKQTQVNKFMGTWMPNANNKMFKTIEDLQTEIV